MPDRTLWRTTMVIFLLTLAIGFYGCREQIFNVPPPGVSPGPPEPEAEMVAAHNQVRDLVGAPHLSWSPELAVFARQWADRLVAEGFRLHHRPNNPYGENLAYAGGMQLTPAQVVGMWASEGEDYDYNSNTCRQGRVCGHYTQIVWAETRKVGCARVRSGNEEIWVCNYDPPGNYAGRRPY